MIALCMRDATSPTALLYSTIAVLCCNSAVLCSALLCCALLYSALCVALTFAADPKIPAVTRIGVIDWTAGALLSAAVLTWPEIDGKVMILRKKQSFLHRHVVLVKTEHLCQDRLGTNIGATLMKIDIVSQPDPYKLLWQIALKPATS
jgi:hypothetical protein